MNTYLVTGATGYVGSNLVRYIQSEDKDSHIIALVRDRKKALELELHNVELSEGDLADEAEMKRYKLQADYIFHCASVTKSSEMVEHPVEVIKSIVNTTQNVCELAKRCQAKSVVYLSSMEVYGDVDCSDGHRAAEDELGYLDILNARSCYPLGKRMAENICYSYYKEYGVPVKIARLAQTFGKGVLPSDSRVFMQFARAAKEKRDIVLHTSGTSMGNYCGIDDVMQGLMTILVNGRAGEAYNVVNEANTMMIRDMAALVCEKTAHGMITVKYDIPQDDRYGYAAATGLRLSGRKLQELGFVPTQSLQSMYEDVMGEI